MKSIICLFLALSTTFFATAQNEASPFTVRMNDTGIPTLERTNNSKNAYQQSAPMAFFGNNHIEVPISTEVTFRTQEIIDPNYATDGQMVRLLVVMDVVIDGEVVIPTNALGLGRIKVVPPTASRPGAVYIEVKTVQDINGARINLNGQQDITRGNYAGEPAGVPADRYVTAYTMNKTKVKKN